MSDGVEHEFNPDWTIAPAAILAAEMKARDWSIGALARACGRGEADFKAGLLIREVLDRKPLRAAHAEMLERGLGTTAQFWLNLEDGYRADLAAGRTDTTPVEESAGREGTPS